MTVVDLSSKRLERERARSCPGCGPAQLCYPHRLEAVAVELRSAQRRMDEELLVPASDVEVMVARVLAVLDGITAECLPSRVRALGTTNNPNNRLEAGGAVHGADRA